MPTRNENPFNPEELLPVSTESRMMPVDLNGPEISSFETVDKQYYDSLSTAQSTDVTLQEHRQASSFERKVLSSIEEIKTQVAHNGALINQILKYLHPQPYTIPNSELIPRLPMTTLQHLQTLEALLVEDEVKNYLIAKLGSIGGFSLGDITRRIMKHLMEPSLSVQLNWCGQRGKTAFKSFLLKDVVCAAVRGNNATRNSKEKEIEESIKMFLKHSKDREPSVAALPPESHGYTVDSHFNKLLGD